MALYEYRCDGCGAEFEMTRPMSEADTSADCPNCQRQARRLPSVFASNQGTTLQVPASGALRERPKATKGSKPSRAGKTA